MTYENGGQFDRALKKAIRNSGGDPGDGYRQALRDRFLCRVFSDPDERFILKGGSGLLARIPDGRATRDIDFVTASRESPEAALTALVALAGKDMGDFLTFKLDKWEESLDENGYSRLLKLRFQTFLGHEEKDPILVDLSLDCSITQPAERISPANRVCVEGLESCGYLVYPLPDQLADKLCAIMEMQPGGWPSSRMKDLVDVVYYSTNVTLLLKDLVRSIKCECSRRGMSVPRRFEAPAAWAGSFAAFAKKSGVPEKYAPFEAASSLASAFFDPALRGFFGHDASWDPESLRWRQEGSAETKER
ncbi:nucleotidyl transferase AbiEii/AbiGii toxin family protein [Olsenella sp. oral taxon 807]|uniref:nucleotidyl transferase AbiEii/AbiGii toxin family protein n=1 Tax=Olsenella sp. oral taxon 807 TaxID=712411 RepID=UPI00067D22E5|nr:nucleotidyl transferase AbiEii/AbiGii toxin family protein [Olsenella sp. oral taxon 807]